MSSSDQLKRAAAKLRETAAAVDAGPPWAVADDAPGVVCSGDLRPWGAPTVAHNLDDGDAAWIALASPAIAEPLAFVLDKAAGLLDTFVRTDGVPLAHALPVIEEELTLARTILGEDS
jgi:hypothetical protein